VTDAPTESVAEEAALAWLNGLGCAVLAGPPIALGELHAKRDNFAQVILEDRLRNVLLARRISGELQVPDAKRIAAEVDP
jgi:hypothetical protein